jgi:aspartate kinase
MLSPLVLKFGGSCFRGVEDYRKVACYVASRVPDGRPAVVVVSARYGMSAELERMLSMLGTDVPELAAAAVLSSADQISAGLMTAALALQGLAASLVTFDRLGWSAAGPAEAARLATVDPAALRAELHDSTVVVLAGGQAVGQDGRLCMLGRNSSDLSCVAAACAVGAAECEIFSDYPGIFTADPRLVPAARPIPEMPYDFALAMADHGARVVHPGAIDLARRHSVDITLRSQPPEAASATRVVGKPAVPDQPLAAVVADHNGLVWAFPDSSQRDATAMILAASTQGFVCHSDATGAYIAATASATLRTIDRECRRFGKRTSLRLVTVIRSGDVPMRALVPQRNLSAFTQEWHDEILSPVSNDVSRTITDGECR